MTRALGILLSGFMLAAGAQDDAEEPSRWRYNARGRTEAAIEHQSDGDLEAADRAFGTALGLEPGDPLVQFNAGTASLLSAGDQAVDLLQSAALAAPPDLKPLAYYNLGNAHFAAEDMPQAVESFKESLRLEPGNLDVKHNLELAQRRLEQQQQQQDQQPEDEQQEQQDQKQQQQQEEERQQQPSPEEQQQQGQPERSDSPLPEFEDQPDMTAEQAAAILEAVENLEREQRRQQAIEQMKRAKGDRDW